MKTTIHIGRTRFLQELKSGDKLSSEDRNMHLCIMTASNFNTEHHKCTVSYTNCIQWIHTSTKQWIYINIKSFLQDST